MRCTEICSKDTLLISNEVPKLKSLLEIYLSIFSNKYKYVDTPAGVKLLIKGIKTYTISYISNTKREKIITKNIEVPFFTFMPVTNNGYGYRSVEFIVEKLNVVQVDALSVTINLSFKIICNENFREKQSEIINPDIIDIKSSESTFKFKQEKNEFDRNKKEDPSHYTYKNRNRKGHGVEVLNYLIYQNIKVFGLVLFLLIIEVYLNQNKLR